MKTNWLKNERVRAYIDSWSELPCGDGLDWNGGYQHTVYGSKESFNHLFQIVAEEAVKEFAMFLAEGNEFAQGYYIAVSGDYLNNGPKPIFPPQS